MEVRHYTGIEEVLEKTGKLVYTNVGTSMMPLLRQGRDLMVIERKGEERCRKYDVVLFKRDNDVGKYILHRVIKVRKEDYLIVGDNQWRVEKGITDRHILGVLKAVVKDDKTIEVDNLWYKLYVHLWCDLFPIRAFILFLAYLPGRLRRAYRDLMNTGSC